MAEALKNPKMRLTVSPLSELSFFGALDEFPRKKQSKIQKDFIKQPGSM